MVEIKQLLEKDRAWVKQLMEKEWGSPRIVTRGHLHDTGTAQGFVATESGKPIGLVLYIIKGDQCEILTLNSLEEGKGVGTKLVDAVKDMAKTSGCTRVWTITTNDNVSALRFYQKRGFVLVALYPNALDASRKLKPEIPKIGKHGIPLRDEIELALFL